MDIPKRKGERMNISQIIDEFYNFIEATLHPALLEAAREKQPLTIDFMQLAKFNLDLTDELLAHPEECIKACQQAIQRFDVDNAKLIRPRFKNLPKSTYMLIREVRAEDLGKFVTMLCQIKTKSEVRPQARSAKFECPSCGNVMTIAQTDSKFQKPTACPACGRKGSFKMLSMDLMDTQNLKVEEVQEDLHGGEQPKRINLFLTEDLASPFTDKKTNPGSKIIATGIIREIPIQTKGAQSVTFDLLFEANYIEPLDEDFIDLKISKDEEDEIRKLAADPEIYMKLRESVAPSIYGHERIKDALVLQLFSGVRKVRKDGVVTRGDTHILLIGDPGSGKSQLIKRMSVVAPKSKYVGGKGVSGAGLTATVIRDEVTGTWTLEAGALVLAHLGFCFIDEMDKMSADDRNAMHEALEQQSVSISKANIQATLRCETTVLAAANPKFGRFDPYMAIGDQIDMPPSLINRFDLIFPVKDLPSKDRDRIMSNFILKLHQTGGAKTQEVSIPTELLRKYVAFARQTCKPQLTDDAVQTIEDYYVTMRNSDPENDRGSIPISARQLEGIIRLSEASAKVRLKEYVSADDARMAIDLVQYCLMEIALDKETGKIDIDKISSGIASSERSKIVGIQGIINKLTETVGRVIPVEDIIKEAESQGIPAEKVDEALEKLSRNGDIFEPRKGFISKL